MTDLSHAYSGKVCLITGAASGFGRLLAGRLAGQGARLVLGDLDEAGAAEAAKGAFEAEIRRCDVTQEVDAQDLVQAALDQFGRLDAAFNNAGVVHANQRLGDLTVEEFDRVMAVNARGVFLALKAQLPVMAQQRAGAILNTASAAGLIGAPTLSAYAASKHAVVGLTRTAADEYARRGVRVNAICPAFAATPMFDGMADQMQVTQVEAEARVTGRIPMRRIATADEVVDAMLWINSSANSYMTGQAIPVDGGLTAV
jgi:NAD(P)-dependent dehydrogenase (short-subunit alcohol dehydrogenase family)